VTDNLTGLQTSVKSNPCNPADLHRSTNTSEGASGLPEKRFLGCRRRSSEDRVAMWEAAEAVSVDVLHI
jgi:hypothetical protein